MVTHQCTSGPLKPSQCTSSAQPQVPTGHHQHLQVSLHSPSVSLVRQTQPGIPTFTGSQPELRSPGQGQRFELSLCGAWTNNIQHLQFSTWPRPFSSPHTTVALMQKSQNGIKSNAPHSHSSFGTSGIYFTFPIVHPWLYTFVGSRLWLRQLAEQLQSRRCQGLSYAQTCQKPNIRVSEYSPSIAMVRSLLSLMVIFMDPCQFLYVLPSSPLHSKRTPLFSPLFPQIYSQKFSSKKNRFSWNLVLEALAPGSCTDTTKIFTIRSFNEDRPRPEA